MNPTYTRLTEGFKEWLYIIGYTPKTIDSMPRRINELLLHLENTGVQDIEQVTKEQVKEYNQLQKTSKSRQTKELRKNSTLNGIIRAWRLFAHYLEETDQGTLPVPIHYEPSNYIEREVLTHQEIQALYNAADEGILGLRDRAILSVYYGCGLRRNEGVSLDLSDVMTDKGLLYVRKGKGYKERYVPFTESVQTDFKLYLQQCRPRLVNNTKEKSFLVNNKGTRINFSTQNNYLKKILERASITKPIGLHNLRHSIATHLMKSGMKIEDIAKFLGHAYLSSTQIYTHIAHEYEGL